MRQEQLRNIINLIGDCNRIWRQAGIGMRTYPCTVCGKQFSVPQAALDKYPGWIPKYCRDHSPKQTAAGASSKKRGDEVRAASRTAELNLPLAEVLAQFKDGPQTGIFTDGSSQPNPGPGGWGCVLVLDGKIVEHRHGHDPDTTNNRMELAGMLNGIELLGEHPEIPGPITVYTDSELLVNTFTKWADGWAARGWKRKTGPIANLELVQEVYELLKREPRAKLEWIKAHNGWLWNEYADSLSTAWTREEL